jgi:lysophospholipase L1-like esterase
MEKNKIKKNIENLNTLEDAMLHNDIENSTYKTIHSIICRLRENKGLQIKLLGDSITHGYSGTGFAQDGAVIVEGWSINTEGYCWANLLRDYLQSKFVCTVKNFGMSGATSKDLFTNMETLIEAEDDIIICMIGTNNRSLEDGKRALYDNLIAIGNYVKKQGKEIIFMSSIPSSIKNETQENKYFHMESVDFIVMSAAAHFNQEYISIYKELMNYCDFKNITIDSLLADGLHPNDTGYLVMFNIICDKLGIGRKRPDATW